MDEYSRIVIENYCMTHKSPKSRFLNKLIKMSYYVEREPTDADMIKLKELIEQEMDLDLKLAMEDLDQYFCAF